MNHDTLVFPIPDHRLCGLRPPVTCPLCHGHRTISAPGANVECPRCHGFGSAAVPELARLIGRHAGRPVLRQEDGRPLMYLDTPAC